MFRIEVINVEAIAKNFRGRLRDVAPVMKEAIGVEADRIEARTYQGIDVFGAPFKPYSEKWAEVRAENGLPTSIVTHSFTGGMFEAMSFGVAQRGNSIVGGIFFKGAFANEKAITCELHERHFFGLSESQAMTLYEKIKGAL
jgi:hypothetical protein